MPLPLHFVSGLPRSGSTLLMNLLGQNPAHHVGPTSGLVHLVRAVQRQWPKCQEFRAQGLETVRPFVHRGLQGLISGFYSEQLDAGKTVFDKSRGWVQYVELIESVLQQPVRVIVMVRDVRSIAASWEKIYRSRGIEFVGRDEESTPSMDTVEGRVKRGLSRKNVTGRSIRRVRDAIGRCSGRLVIVPYSRLAADPVRTMSVLHATLGLPDFDYDPDHVAQVTHEDDNYLGAKLHTIRPKIEPEPLEPWKGVLPDDLADRIAESYADLNALAAGQVVDGGED